MIVYNTYENPAPSRATVILSPSSEEITPQKASHNNKYLISKGFSIPDSSTVTLSPTSREIKYKIAAHNIKFLRSLGFIIAKE